MQQLTLAQAFARAPKEKSSPRTVTVEPTVPKKSVKISVQAVSVSKILFGPHGPHPDFDQFSSHPVTYNGAIYPTSQHLFQAFKFLDNHPDIAESIRRASTPELAFDIAHSNKASYRSDWSSVNISKMEEALFMKFSQHPLPQQELLATGHSELYQDSTTDSFWGVGSDLLGRNELGRALERVRQNLGGAPASVRKVLQCQKCRNKPRVGELLYCGDSCLRADINTIAPLCPQCGRRPQIGKLKFCGETCRKIAAKSAK
ncbi:hypothetical protein C8F04DRAFT_1072540 [Mycena alexandri]|uniref:NADAR domain-containing protein n=1 Tax=Mycena alexandri TaxID=1745969 RepID=A0AAD6XCQ8_9AGAR|nr:hypothetical protein C8F04DRAFT_1072540 [Mycena alexandri]